MSTPRLVLEFAHPGDAPAIALMSRDLIEEGLGWGYRHAEVTRLIVDPETVALVARVHGHLLGFAIMTFGDERAHLVLLAVRPRERRRGVGRRMLTWLVESAAAAGIASVHVELRARNAAAIGLYRAQGFVETLRIPGYYRGIEPAIRMIRVLRVPGAAAVAWQPPARKAS